MDLTALKKEIDAELQTIKTDAECGTFHQKYLSKNGKVTALMTGLRDVAPDQRAKMGAELNALKNEVTERIFALQREIKERSFAEKLMQDKLIDITVPDLMHERGSLHPITRVIRDVEEIFANMGFIIADSPEVATEYENFISVNVPASHPARDMQDTFWLSNGSVLKTHTSAMQNNLLKKYGPTFRAIIPGRCFRNEALDAKHDTTFFQIEGMMVGEDVSIANLVYFMKEALTAVFKKDIRVRLRPGYFPFTEPGFELDASCIFCGGKEGCHICKGSGWIEFCGCGMIHPKVLEMGGVDPNKYQGFAFGFGLTRLAMMRYGIDDIRQFNSGNLEFLKGIQYETQAQNAASKGGAL